MLMFLATILDQMDLALEHIVRSSVHDARFGLMLTDNALELAVHEFAKSKHGALTASRYLEESYPHKKELEAALGRDFEAKLKFAKMEDVVTSEQARTIKRMHVFRNELYHLGLQHEAILPALAKFYFSMVCEILASYPIRGFGYWYGIQLPERSKKYFTNHGKGSPAKIDDFHKACGTMEIMCDHKKSDTIRTLADQMDRIIHECDTYLDVVAAGVYNGDQETRNQATIKCQTWPLSFSIEGRDFAKLNGFDGRNTSELLDWLGRNYPLPFKKDPIPGWRTQAVRLRSKRNPHAALESYVAFMDNTAQIREAYYEGAAAVESEIDRLIDERRGN